MYALIFSIVLSLYAMIVVDASLLFKEISVQGDLINSAQAFYAAEGVLEATLLDNFEPDVSRRNRRFSERATQSSWNSSEALFQHHQGVPAHLADRQLQLNDSIMIHQTDESDSFTSIEPLARDYLVIRDVPLDARFNQIQFDFGTHSNQEVLFEVFQFKKDGQPVDFQNFDALKTVPSATAARMVINTKDTTSLRSYDMMGNVMRASFSNTPDYSRSLFVTGFNPVQFDYALSFQTLDNAPTPYRFSALYQNRLVSLPSLHQSIRFTGVTSTGLFQTLRFQRRSEEGLSNGLQFVHFSNQSIDK